MPNTTHTPGPWTVSQVVHNSQLKPSDRRGYSGSIAYVWTDRPYPTGKCVASVREELLGEVEANARLIAAAPELLACLDVVKGWLITMKEADLIVGDIMLDKVKTAIAKAKGE